MRRGGFPLRYAHDLRYATLTSLKKALKGKHLTQFLPSMANFPGGLSGPIVGLLFGGFISLSGCATSDESLRSLPVLAASEAANLTEIATSPLSLEDAVRLSLLSSNRVMSSNLVIQQEENRVQISRAAFYPELYADLSAGDNEGTIGIGSAGINYTLYDFGKRSAELAATRAASAQAGYDQIVDIETTVVEVVTQYIDAAVDAAQSDTSRLYVQSVDALQDAVEARVEIGVSSNVDLNEVETGRLNASAEQIGADADAQNSLAALNSLIGLQAGSLRSTEELDRLLRPRQGVLAIPDDLEAYPRIASLKQEVAVAEQSLVAVRAGLWPSLGVRLGVGLELTEQGFDRTGVVLGPQVSTNYSLGGGRAERIQNAELGIMIAQRELDEEERLIRLRFLQATTALDAAFSTIESRSSVVDLAVQTRDVMQSEYEIGSRSLRDLIDAEERIHNARIALNEASRAVLKARLEVLLAANLLSENLYRQAK